MLLLVDPTDSAAYPTIQAAIDAAADGDTVSIATGTYTECLDLNGRSLTLEGDATVTGASACAADSSVLATLGETFTVRGLQLRNPTGRVFEVVGGALTLDGVTISDVDSTATYLPGAGVSISNGTLAVTGSTFTNLRAAEGGAIFAEASDVFIETSVFESTYARYFGGAIEFESSGDEVLTIAGTTFTASEVGNYAGSAIYAWTSDTTDAHTTTVTIDTTEFVGSVSGTDAGAVALGDIDVATIEDCRFEQNGAVIGGAVFAEDTEQLAVRGTSFVANTSSTSVAGAVYVRGGAATISRNVFVGNEATMSIVGALEVYDAIATVQNNSFVGNGGHSSAGAGVILVRSSTIDFRNNLVAYSFRGPAVWVYDSTSVGTWEYNSFWANVDGDTAAYASFSTSADGNLAVDPSLVAWSDDDDFSNDDLRLATGSPLIDAGDPAILDDDGSVSDIGAYAGSVATDSDGDGYGRELDCDDHDASVSPGAIERCNGTDDNCDGTIDEDAVDQLDWFVDDDGDGWGGDVVLPACETPEGYVGSDGDCDDGDASVAPGADEVCDGVDQDCDGEVDEDALDAATWYADGDGDAYGAEPVLACELAAGFAAVAGDCDDGDAAVNPGAAESCDGVDDDCDGVVDEAGALGGAEYHPDEDGDGYGSMVEVETWCAAPEGWTADGSDCDDSEGATYPGAPDEWYDGVDADCAGDDDDDQDHDGYDVSADCDDTDDDVYPGAADEWYDGVDSDCAGNDDNDQDGDGIAVGADCDDTSIAVYPGAPDTWYDGIDSDCQGDDDNDQDRDGYALDEDCDDTNAALYPGATDIAGDGIDQDCDGADRETTKDAETGGCGCSAPGAAPSAWAALLGLAVLRRRSSQR